MQLQTMGKTITDNTICAISTAPGIGGIAVIRVSGNNAIECVEKIWQGKKIAEMASHTAHLGTVIDSDGSPLDQVVLTLFRAPRSFTGEDVIEIACHGSLWVQQQLIRILIDAGCTMATGGEFTQRAFLNHRIDLSQAEAIADLIASSSRAAHRIALNQMRGGFSAKLKELREQLLTFASLMELELDFSEEEVEFADRSHLTTLANEIHTVISSLAASFATGNAIKNGVPVAIVGETNVGKSTLLNTLLNEEKALVSDIHGTTRDVIEDTITISGTMFRFIDTAGIRQTTDQIESMGIDRTFKKLDEARVVLWVIDATRPAADIDEIAEQIAPKSTEKTLIAVVNKIDAATPQHLDKIRKATDRFTTIEISAKQHTGIDTLQQALLTAAHLPEHDSNELIITNARHYQALTLADEAILRAIDGLEASLSGDFISQDIRECMHYLGEITGEITTDTILQTIFSRFCIGK